MTNIANLGKPSIDSCKIRIPLSFITSIDNALNRTKLVIDEESGEIEKQFKKTAKQYDCDCYSFYVSIARIRHSAKGVEDCIILLLNSKQLEGNYFTGLNGSTIETIYNKVIELKILDCSLDTFQRAMITDIDVKKDYLMEMDNYKEIVKGCAKMSKESSQSDVGHRVVKGKNNYGIQWSKRHTTKYLANPFTKIYHKGLNLIQPTESGGAKDFKDRYLNHIDTKDIIRIETTVKDKKHLQSLKLGLKYFTLLDVVTMSDEQLNWIIKSAINKHLSKRIKTMVFKDKKQLRPQHQFELDALLICTSQLNWSLVRSIEYYSNNITNKDTRSRLKSRLTDLYNDYINETDYAPKVDKVNSFFDSIGWF